ncbi:MAG: YkgJ family cysteine cluster protein, partial [Proteobacteria bacterium]
TVQKLIELSISQHSSQDSVSCRKSCAFCCHTPVSVTKSEVDQIYDYLEAQRISGAGEAAHPRPKGACTFLSRDSSCSIYDVRPIACRKLMAVSHPALCNSEEANSPSYLLFIEAELIASAFYNLESTSPGMMQTLLDFFGPSRAHILGRSTFGTISHEQPETHDI